MEKLNELQLEQVSGGGTVGAFCGGFAVAVTVYGVGAVANLWNPIGLGATLGLAAVTIACAVY